MASQTLGPETNWNAGPAVAVLEDHHRHSGRDERRRRRDALE
jgi:hypothetical protein